MKIKTASIGMVLLLTIGVIIAASFSLGCTEQEKTPAEPAENTSVKPAENTPAEPAENTSIEPAETTTQKLEPISAGDVTGIKWQWASFQDSDSPETQVMVPHPENYTLTLFPDGTYHIKADCNSGSGTYTLEGNDLTLGPATITLMACGPESMDGEYLSLLPTVEAAALEDGQLVLYPGNEGDRMFFTNGGKAEQ
ncbi:hypothetical protein MSLAZ_1527 [Methanosarcina lacustris Z-7289]|uniref:Cyclic nucleotide-binding domain-containing protein n=1 Tax=Methanosarcina lacustris Z-7289 TaxID=1434111 RepID=A0A0E3S725_9EURY|nr:META domain-containing protein [Methanosarcina lacustris]AKB74788.1 hypothetical protein MSLAZ_1527 [Methanosarcina lacustris Z-7289]